MMSNSTMLSSQTVAQLKTLCKELGIKNYSKLAKPALIDKILAAKSASSALAQPEPTTVASQAPNSNPAPSSALLSASHGSFSSPSSSLVATPTVSVSARCLISRLPSDPKRTTSPSLSPPPKRTKTDTEATQRLLTFKVPTVPQSTPKVSVAARSFTSVASSTNAKSNGFRPLVPLMRPHEPNPRGPKITEFSRPECSVPDSSRQLDFTLFPLARIPLARLMTFPMPFRQRESAQKWAIILMRLADQDRVKCALVSKAIRYAVYLSAIHILHADFAGARLAAVMRGLETSSRDLWPYLRSRRHEKFVRRLAYNQSFLPRFFARLGVHVPLIAPVLWASPDHEDQLTVVIRFLIAKVWFTVSLGGDTSAAEWFGSETTIVDAQEVVRDEVWALTQSSGTVLHVLYETCEVLGNGALRADWAVHVEHGSKTLRARVVWHNGEEYDEGISKAWRERVGRDSYAFRIAQRYVLACVAANSVSGSYKTARQLADEFAGVTRSDCVVPLAVHREKRNASVPALYLPDHHYVEHVSFCTLKSEPLHPALAAVQTPAREYIVLRDTGMLVGSEEDGVAAVWMDILGCDMYGKTVSLR